MTRGRRLRIVEAVLVGGRGTIDVSATDLVEATP